jgi:hypothetical protein
MIASFMPINLIIIKVIHISKYVQKKQRTPNYTEVQVICKLKQNCVRKYEQICILANLIEQN